MTVPTFRPIDSTAFDDDRAVSAEHGRRIVRDTLAVLNERCVHIGGPFRRYAGDGSEVRTLWRWAATWQYLGPFHIYVPPQIAAKGYVRVLIGARTNGGAGHVRIYAHNPAVPVDEATMTNDTSASPPLANEQWFVCQSGPGVTDFDFAVLMPVVPGWNDCFLAILCDEDTNRAPVNTTSPASIILKTTQTIGGTIAPALKVTGNVSDVIGRFAYISLDATLFALGEFDTLTMPYGSNSGNDRILHVHEPSLDIWGEVDNTSQFGFLSERFTTVVYFDSISIDGSVAYTLEERQFGPQFRYQQVISAGLTRVAVDDAQNAHFARLPMAASQPRLLQEVPVALDLARGVPSYHRYLLISKWSSSFVEFRRVCLGIAAATPTIDVQDTFTSPVKRWEVCFSCILASYYFGEYRDINVEFRLRILDETGAQLASESIIIAPSQSRRNDGSAISHQIGQSISLTNPTGGALYGTEGLYARDDLSTWSRITMTIDGDDLDTEEIQYLVLEARHDQATVDSSPTAVLSISPLAVRLTDVR